MQLLTCEACDHQVSPSARRCPNCGHSLKQLPKPVKVLIAVCIFVGLFYWFDKVMMQRRVSEADRALQQSVSEADRALQQSVKDTQDALEAYEFDRALQQSKKDTQDIFDAFGR